MDGRPILSVSLIAGSARSLQVDFGKKETGSLAVFNYPKLVSDLKARSQPFMRKCWKVSAKASPIRFRVESILRLM